MVESTGENGVYKKLSADMRAGLKNIYEKAAVVTEHGHATDALFSEASGQLDEVVKTTESAAMTIMEIVEKLQTQAGEEKSLLKSLEQAVGPRPELARLGKINSGLSDALMMLVTTLSFQDIAGQRIKKAMTALKAIESSVLELYLTSGLIMDAAEKEPSRSADAIAEEAAREVEKFKVRGSELKGPDKNAPSQSAIDDMLAQLGL